MYLIGQPCLTRSSLLKEGLYDLGFVIRSRLKAHTVVEDETWILVGIVLVGDISLSRSIMSDIDGGLQSSQRWIKSS